MTASPIYYSSYTSHRVVCRVLRRELYALADAVDLAQVLCEDLRAAVSCEIPVAVFLESLRLLNAVIHTSTVTTENRLTLDITAIMEDFKKREIHWIGGMRSGDNLAHGFTKAKRYPAVDAFLCTALLKADVTQSVNRDS